MRFKEFITEGKNYPGKAAKKAERKARRAGERTTAAEAEAKAKAEKKAARDALFDGSPISRELKVRVVKQGGHIVTRTFTFSKEERVLKALNKAEHQMVDRNHQNYHLGGDPAHGASIPAQLYGLPERTRRKPGYAPEDMRREVYDA